MGVGIYGPCNFLNETIYNWWNIECHNKLKPLFNAVLSLILWVIWKRRNKIKHGDTYNVRGMIVEVSRCIHRFARSKYPWVRNIPEDWNNLVQVLGGYKPIIVPNIVY